MVSLIGNLSCTIVYINGLRNVFFFYNMNLQYVHCYKCYVMTRTILIFYILFVVHMQDLYPWSFYIVYTVSYAY
jgi:hypothetical protein